MPVLISSIPHHLSIKNIIFDFGGVICDLDISRTEKKFAEMGVKKFDRDHPITEMNDLIRRFEGGRVSIQEFHDGLKKFFTRPVQDNEIDEAWNALLLEIPEARIRLLEKIRKDYRIFLLSNSNAIHYNKYLSGFTDKFGYKNFDELFEKAFFSFQLQLQKPDREVFEYVLKAGGMNPYETLFIDDTLRHVEGANKTGINGYHLKIKEGQQITDLFI